MGPGEIGEVLDEKQMRSLINGGAPEYDHLYFIEIVWVGHHTTRMLLSNTQLGSSFQEWETEYRSKAGTKPGWFNLGGLTFYSQNVISIELIETIEQEG